MKTLLASWLMLVPVGSLAGGEPYACNMRALTKNERTEHLKLTRTLLSGVKEQKELANGYAFRLSGATIVEAARWVSLERKCCPFFTFGLDLEGHDGPLWMRVTGSDGIKPFIRAEFQLGS